MEPTYDNVEPLLSRSRVNGQQMEYVFRCPVTGFEATGTAAIAQYSGANLTTSERIGLGNPRVAAESEAGWAAQSAAGRLVPGGDIVASFAENIFRLRRGKKRTEQYAAAAATEVQEAPKRMLLEAFGTVADEFRWDDEGGRWIRA
jgi:hypothetical protein